MEFNFINNWGKDESGWIFRIVDITILNIVILGVGVDTDTIVIGLFNFGLQIDF